jgi:hypothetical protein
MGNQSQSDDIDAFHNQLKRYEEHTRPFKLHFNGGQLRLLENGKEIAAWPAVSGAPGTQGAQYQEWRDRGSLPRGAYGMKVGDIQKISLAQDLWGQEELPRANWKGGRPSWGNFRAWLTPKSSTNALGRTGLAIHGGDSPGSNGCIDLTSHMDDFVEVMRALGQDRVDVIVDYDGYHQPNDRWQ